MPAFGAKISSEEVITNPETPPKILSDSLSITSANFGFNLNLLEIWAELLDAVILVVSRIRPCELETYLLEITITSPLSNEIWFSDRALVISSNKTKFPF